MADENENYGRRKTDRINAQYGRTYRGKSYDLFDIQNLKEANKQMAEQLRLRQENFKVHARTLQMMDEQIASGKRLNELDQKIYNMYKREEQELTNLTSTVNQYMNDNQKRIDELSRNWNRFITNTMQNPLNSSEVIQNIVRQSSKDNKPMPKSISELFRQTLTDNHERKKEAAINRLYQDVAGSVTNRYKRQGADFTDPTVVAKMNNEIQQETASKASGALKKFSVGAELINVASDTFKRAVDDWAAIFKMGLKNQSQAYEDTFTNVSVRNGTTRQNYADAKWKMNNYLDEQGLRNNIASSEVYRMWDKMATSGIQIDLSNEESRAEISAKAIDNVLTNKIVPYLDTSTAQWDQLVSAQPELQKNIRGINRLNTDLVGNNYATKDLLQNILDDLQPIADSALNDLAMSAAGATTFINSMMESGMDEATAKSLWTEYYKQQQYGAQILRSGTTNEKMALVNANVNGINIMDSEDTPEALANIARTRLTTSNYGPGYGSTMDAIVQSSVNGSVGTDPRFAMWAYGKGNKAFDIINQAENNGNEAIELYKQYGENATNDFANDKNQTNKKLQEITVENLMNELSVINDWLGNWAGVIETAIKGIGAILLTKIVGGIIGKGIGALSGLGGTALGASGGLGALLGTAGPIALGIGAGVAITAAINKAVREKAKEENEKDKKKSNMEIRGLAEDLGIDEGEASLMKAGSNIYNSDKNWLGSTFDNYENAELFGAQLGWWDTLDEKDFKQTMDSAYKDTDTLKYNKAKIGRALNYGGIGFGPETLKQVATAWMIGLYSQGYDGKNANILKAIEETLNTSFTPDEDSITKLMNGTNNMTRSQFNRIVELMKNADMWLWNENGKWIMPNEGDYDKVLKLKGIDAEQREWLSSHRQGLNLVPYDDYPALLHQGEAVLTAATANELRSLLDEYRDTTQQTVNFDNIIRTQTQDLITKMDEIKQVMINSSSSIGNFTDTLQQTKAKEILYTSMKHVHSTKSF